VSAFDDDIDTMLEDFDPVWLVDGVSSGNATSEVWDEDVLHGANKGVMSGSLALLIKTSQFPNLKIGAYVLVQQKDSTGAPVLPGTSYQVMDRQRPIQYADGGLTHVLLQAA